MKCVLITGGCGFIGSNIVEFIKNNHTNIKIKILDNLSTGKLSNIENFLNDQIEYIYGDISDLEICRKAMLDVDCICHQAALGSVPRSVEDPLKSHISNVNGFLNILIAAKEFGIKRVVYASSSSVYGDNETLPKQEDKTGKVLSPYAATKAIDEIYANVFTKCYGMEIIGLRYFNVFGPRQDPNGAYAAVIPKFIDLMMKRRSPKVNGDGSYSRDFTFVKNVVSANMLALTTKNEKCYGDVFNIGAGGRFSIKELFETIKERINFEGDAIYGELRAGDIPHSNADISKSRNELSYNPQIDFKQGLNLTIDYFLKE